MTCKIVARGEHRSRPRAFLCERSSIGDHGVPQPNVDRVLAARRAGVVGITVAVEVRSAAVIMEAVVIMEVAVTEVAATGAEVIMEAGATEAVATAEADMVAVDTGADMDITDAI